MEVGNLKFAWKIKNFSKIQDKIIYSNVFPLGPYKWKIRAHPNGKNEDSHLSIYIEVADSETLPSRWSLKAKFSFTLVDQIDNKSSIKHSSGKIYEYKAETKNLGYSSFISHENLHDPNKGYLVEDTCIINVDVTIYGDNYLESHVSSKETNKAEDLAKNATEEDIDAFFGDLNSVIFPKKVVSMKEEAKEALATIEEALNMTPTENDNIGRMAQLTNAFDVLSSYDDCSAVLLEQKAKLLSMKDNFIALPERAANAGKTIKLFTEKELVKKTLDYKLGRSLIEFEKIKLETKQSEQNIATLQERVDSLLTQIGETKRKRENLIPKLKEMFKGSMVLKSELDALVKDWPEFEAKMKAAKEEEEIVNKEWDEMKKLVSSVNTFF